jgi:RNA polymerase sigma-70 factor, ECF subfamily
VERSLVERAQRGDQHAFAVLVTGSIDRLYTIAYRILRDAELARDATQQAFLEAWHDLPSLRDPARWEAWSYRLVVHACYARKRSERRYGAAIRVLTLKDIAFPDVQTSVADRDQLERGFRGLPIEQRAVVVLHHYVGLPLTEVADLLDIPAGTARSRLHNATRRLRGMLEADAATPAERTGPTG